MRILVLLVIGIVRFASASNRTEPCPAEGEFRCRSSGRCIPVQWLCDGARDCGEGEDESEWRCHRHNHTRCAGDQPECGMPDGTFRCILHQWLCDGHEDCEDGSDEKDCETKPPDLPSSGHLDSSLSSSPKCSPSEFRCAGGSCILRDLVCDDVPHCPDGSDESEDRCATPPRIAAPEPAHEEVEERGNWTGNSTMDTQGSRSMEWTVPDPTGTPSFNVTKNEIGVMDLSDSRNSTPNQTPTFTQKVGLSANSSNSTEKITQNPLELPGIFTDSMVSSSSRNSTGPSTSNGLILPPLQPPQPIQQQSESAFHPQIDESGSAGAAKNRTQSVMPTLIPNHEEKEPFGPIEDHNQEPPDPFPFDLANYEIPEAEDPEEGHDEATGAGTLHGTVGYPSIKVTPFPSGTGSGGETPIQDKISPEEKTREELQLANVLQFMSNETKKLLKSINATKGHAVHSYKTLRNKSEVHSLSSYQHLPGLYARLLPFEEVHNKTEETEKKRERVRRNPVRFRAVQYDYRLNSKRQTNEKKEEEEKSKGEEKEPTPRPIVPLQLQPLEGHAVQPILPVQTDNEVKEQSGTEHVGTKEDGGQSKQEEAEQKKPGSHLESEKVKEPEPDNRPAAKPTVSKPESAKASVPLSTTSTTVKTEISANEDPGPRKPSVARGSGSEAPLAMLTRSERIFSEEGREHVVKDERPEKRKPRRMRKEEYEDYGEGTIE